MSTDFCEIQKLVELFQTAKNRESGSEDELLECTDEVAVSESKGKKKIKKPSPYDKADPEVKQSQIVEDIEEFCLENDESRPNTDWKKSPKWEVSYRQQVTATDVFLGMGPKNPSTASCENMIVTIHLPGDDRHNMDLKVLKDRLQLNSPNHYLDVPLPHPVDPQAGNAQWDASAEKLEVTMKMDREFDYMNF